MTRRPRRTSTTRPGTPWPSPAHWVLPPGGPYGQPSYTNVQFPFPIDPPHVPDENPTGDYRRRSTLPAWGAERVLLRFDGVESLYRVWVNGTEIGIGKGSRLVQEFDRHRRRPTGRERDRRPRPPVVGDELRRGPGPVVAARDLPRRHRAGPADRGDRRRLAADRVRRRRGVDRPGVRGGRRPRTRSPSPCPNWTRAHVRRLRTTSSRSTIDGGRAVECRGPAALRRAGGVGRRDDQPADRLPHGDHRRRPVVDQRPRNRRLPRDEPARDPSGAAAGSSTRRTRGPI